MTDLVRGPDVQLWSSTKPGKWEQFSPDYWWLMCHSNTNSDMIHLCYRVWSLATSSHCSSLFKREAKDSLYLEINQLYESHLSLQQDFNKLENNLSCVVLEFFGKDGEEPKRILAPSGNTNATTPWMHARVCVHSLLTSLWHWDLLFAQHGRWAGAACLPRNTRISTQTENPNRSHSWSPPLDLAHMQESCSK